MNVQWVIEKPRDKRKKFTWLGAPPLGHLGAMDVIATAQAKGLLASWNGSDGGNCITGYGLQTSDTNPNSWGDRDGWVLACFVKWWNGSGKTPKLPEQGTKNGVVWADLTQQHLSTLQQWGLEKGVINAGQIPPIPGTPQPPLPVPPGLEPADLATCLQGCAQLGLDPIAQATCAAGCAQKFPMTPPGVPPSPQPPPPPGVPPSPQPPPQTSTTPASTKSNTGLWVAGGIAAAIGIGLLVFKG